MVWYYLHRICFLLLMSFLLHLMSFLLHHMSLLLHRMSFLLRRRLRLLQKDEFLKNQAGKKCSVSKKLKV